MKALCTCAAFAVATAFAHGNFADALNQDSQSLSATRSLTKPSNLTPPGDNKHCTEVINNWRKTIDSEALEYKAYTGGSVASDLTGFFDTADCAALKSGAYNHIHSNSGNKFVISASNEGARRTQNMTCTDALEEWKKGFAVFNGKYPEAYQEKTGSYNDPNAVGLVSLLSEDELEIYCGTPDNCTEQLFICFFKESGIEANQPPVSRQMWHKLEESHQKKPALKPHDAEHEECLKAVNDVRMVKGLDLPAFTGPKEYRSLRKKRSIPQGTAYEEALYNLTCEDIQESKIDPTVADEYTLIYAVGDDSETAPTAAEAVEVWKTGFEKLGTDLPPAFTKKGVGRSEVDSEPITGEIYYNNAVGGFASLMADGEREMLCYNATGCEKSALICFITAATLVDKKQPISKETWEKILALKEGEDEDVTEGPIEFKKLGEEENCLAEINEFRTQDNLGLNAFVAEKSTTEEEKREAEETVTEELLKGLSCSALKSGNATILSTDKARSLIYHSGTSATCSDAVEAWKKGYEKFSEVDIPPKYTAKEELYKAGAATNFISLINEAEETVATCYSVTGCTEKALACVLEPAVFQEDTSPITKETWTKVTAVLSSGVGAVSAYGALLSSAIVVVGLFALNF